MSVWMCARATKAGMPIVKPGEQLLMYLADEPVSWTRVTLLGRSRQYDRGWVRVDDPVAEPPIATGTIMSSRLDRLVPPSLENSVRAQLQQRHEQGWPTSGDLFYGLFAGPGEGWAFDLRCPAHHVIHIEPSEMCSHDAAPVDRPVMAGDAIRLSSQGSWLESEVKAGDIGVIVGMVGHALTEGSIIFNASTFRDDHVVSCSGGPGTITTDVRELTRTNETAVLRAWQWRDGWPSAHNAMYYEIEVPVWDWRPTD